MAIQTRPGDGLHDARHDARHDPRHDARHDPRRDEGVASRLIPYRLIPYRLIPYRLRPSQRALPGVRGAAERTDRLVAMRDEIERRERDDASYRPPQSPDRDAAWSLGLKMALAMLAADAVARGLGFESPTWSVLTAAFLATSPPIASARAALNKLVAMVVGIGLGVAGAWAAMALEGIPSLHFAIVGLVAGFLGSRSPDYLFAAVVGTVITFVGSGGGDPLAEVVTQTACMIVIGCLIGPAAALAVERFRRWRFERGTA